MDFREQVILSGLQSAWSGNKNGPFNALEIGCMFGEKEGLSTYHIAKFIYGLTTETNFFSIDASQDHINTARKIIQEYSTDLPETIKFINGYSLEKLPWVCAQIGKINFALIDGGAQPEVCLQEFEQVNSILAENGIIIIDDLQEIERTDNFPHKWRPFGKGTLILPFLLISRYLEIVNLSNNNGSQLMKEAAKITSISRMSERHFIELSNGRHKMMIVGSRTTVKQCNQIYTLKLLEKQIIVKEKNPVQLYRTASLLKNAYILAEAEEQFTALGKNRNISNRLHAGICFHLGEIRFYLKDLEQSESFFNKCLQLNPDHKKAKLYQEFLKNK